MFFYTKFSCQPQCVPEFRHFKISIDFIFYGASIAIAAILAIYKWWERPNKVNLPPGPKGLPIFGSAFQLQVLRDQNEVSRIFAIYGSIFTLRVGSTPFIVVKDRHAAHEALIDKGSIFAARPPSLPSTAVGALSNGGRNINGASYGSYWRSLRRNLVAGTLASSKLHRFAHVRSKAVEKLVSDIHMVAASGEICQVRKHVRFAVFSIVSYMCFGQFLEDEEISRMDSIMHEALSIAAGFSVAKLMVNQVKAVWKSPFADYVTRRREFFLPYVNRAREMAASGELDPGCYIRTLFDMVKQEQGISEEDLMVLIAEFLNAGADTTAVTLEWALACLVNHPDIQQKLFQEIHQETGTEKNEIDEELLQHGDFSYLRAMIKETLRTHPPGFFTLPHAVTQSCKLGEYDIPANAVLFFNTYAMANDPEVWDGPSQFMPERFMGTKVESTTESAVNYAPFGAGRRICPGLALAELHLELLLTRLVHEFEWCSVDGKQVDMSHFFEFTIVMKTPLAAVVKPRASEGS